MSSTSGTDTRVQNRRVLYLSGFDPQGPARYHRLYRDNAKSQAEVSGHRIEVGARQRETPLRDAWSVDATIDGQACKTRYEFLRWDDLVRQNWPSSHWRYLLLALGTNARFLLSGVLLGFMRTTLSGFSVCVAPAVVALGVVLAGLLLVAGAALAWFWAGPVWGLVATGLGASLAALLLRFSRHAESAWYMGWVMRSYAFISRQGRGRTPELDARLEAHTDHLQQCLADAQVDEILVVGHSSGAMLAASIVGRLARRDPAMAADPRLSLLTLGQCFPVLSYQRTAVGFRSDVAAAATALGQRWLDITAPADRCCAALADPVLAVRAFGESAGASPKLLSPQFQKLFKAAAYAELRRDLFGMHFQYIKASALPGDYDYFAITAGPQRLGQRFEAQSSVTDYRELQCLGGPFPHLTSPGKPAA